jgi:hypothetical protein
MLIHGKCHCGNIVFVLEWPDAFDTIIARECGCTFCVKHGGCWTANPLAKLLVTVRQAAGISRYAFGTKTATFHVCTHCGAVPFVTSDIDNHLYAVVNVNTFEDFDSSRLQRQSADFDGEDQDSRLARRKRNWIAEVQISNSTA